jgi:N-acetylglucosaminyldiphosphoundecaprenol N-acetyl-beta-D-mannosaminyltransferase
MAFAEPLEEARALPANKVRLAGFDFDNLSEQEVIEHILSESRAGRGGWVVTPNIDICRKTVRDPALRSMLREASLTVADGMPLLWTAKVNGQPFVDRVTGSSLIFTLSAGAAAAGRSIYLLGGEPGVPEMAGQGLVGRYPGLKVAGTDAPPLGFEESATAIDQIKGRVRDAAPDIIFVGMGFPKQERLITTLMPELPAAWFVGCGAGIPIAAGAVPRAPEWMQRLGLEWVHRLLLEPRRLFRRYIVEDLPFAAMLLARSVLNRACSRKTS